MPDVIQPASTGRAKCRGCGRVISAKTLRFGEALPNAYGEGDSLFWFHLPCAACMRPEKLLVAVESSTGAIPEREWLVSAAHAGVAHPRLPRLARVERASSGRARCRFCRELVEKDHLRLALQMFEDGRFSGIGTIHAQCAEAYLGTADLVDRLRHIQDLDETWLPELEKALRGQRAAPPGEPAMVDGNTDADVASPSAPPLAKTRPADPAAGRRRAN